MLYWLANIYTKWQWNYPELTSKDINEKCSVITLMKLYYPCTKLQMKKQ